MTDPGALAAFDDRYEVKYDVRPERDGRGRGVYVLRPATALAWTEADFPTDRHPLHVLSPGSAATLGIDAVKGLL